MKRSLILCSVLTIVTLGASQEAPGRGYVPNSETAVAITEAVLTPVYGKKLVERERPFTARLKDGVWTVGGTLYCSDGKPQSAERMPSCVGGVAVVKLSQADGRIISMTHYK